MDTIRKEMRRKGESEEEIDAGFELAKEMLTEGEDPEQVLQEVFGLEPDFLFDEEFLGVRNE